MFVLLLCLRMRRWLSIWIFHFLRLECKIVLFLFYLIWETIISIPKSFLSVFHNNLTIGLESKSWAQYSIEI